MTRQAIHRHLQALVHDGTLVSEGKGRATRYRAAGRQSTWRLAREGLSEDEVWHQVRAALPMLSESRYANAVAILSYAFTEMLNNAIDHSRAATVDIAAGIGAGRARFVIEDDGIGAFENVRATQGLPSALEALQEISKGKLSTAPERHSGEGIFFTSKVAELFELEANGLRWTVDNARSDYAISAVPSRAGTIVRFELPLDAAVPLEQTFAKYTHDFEFDTSRAIVKLFEYGTRFVSRSEAKRLLAGLERFRQVILDFAGVEGVGQGFADEVFRVWVREHPETLVRAEHMTAPVTFMVERARRAQP